MYTNFFFNCLIFIYLFINGFITDLKMKDWLISSLSPPAFPLRCSLAAAVTCPSSGLRYTRHISYSQRPAVLVWPSRVPVRASHLQSQWRNLDSLQHRSHKNIITTLTKQYNQTNQIWDGHTHTHTHTHTHRDKQEPDGRDVTWHLRPPADPSLATGCRRCYSWIRIPEFLYP